MRGMKALSELSKASKKAKNIKPVVKEGGLNMSIENHPLVRQQKEEIKELSLQVSELKASLVSLVESKDSEISTLKKTVEKPRSTNSPLDSDEMLVLRNKELQSISAINLMAAIDTESEIQGTVDVVITRKMMINLYNVNTAFITTAIKALSGNNFIRVNMVSERKRTLTKLRDLPNVN
jgi:hypothetical protein